MADTHGFMNANTCSAEMWKQYFDMLFSFVVFFFTTFLFLPPGAEAAPGLGPLQQLLPAVPG